MKTIASIVLIAFSLYWPTHSQLQDTKPVEWIFEVQKMGSNEYQLKSTAKISAEWAMYSQHTAEGGPIPTSFTYNDKVELLGETEEKSEAIKKMSSLFEIEVIKYKREAVFVQRFKVKDGQKSISGSVRFMCCDNEKCLPPTEETFDILL